MIPMEADAQHMNKKSYFGTGVVKKVTARPEQKMLEAFVQIDLKDQMNTQGDNKQKVPQ